MAASASGCARQPHGCAAQRLSTPHRPRYLEGVKPGMYVSITEDVVVGAWAQPDAATPTMVFGVPLR
jgi:hypothetical protein